MVEIIAAHAEPLSSAVKVLFQEYARSLDFKLCFQNFNQELADWPGQYFPPTGGLFLALSDDKPIGCVGFRQFSLNVCEMKRLYVQPAYQGHRVGRRLAEAVINAARKYGYTHMRLDTIANMIHANQLYRKLGFRPIPAYRENPICGANYLELHLTAP